MLSEIAIDDSKAFAELVNAAKNALEGKKTTTKKAEVKETKTTKKETKTTKKEEKTDLSKLKVSELKELAKEKGIKGYTTMKKAELLDALK
jgi:ribosomal protein L20